MKRIAFIIALAFATFVAGSCSSKPGPHGDWEVSSSYGEMTGKEMVRVAPRQFVYNRHGSRAQVAYNCDKSQKEYVDILVTPRIVLTTSGLRTRFGGENVETILVRMNNLGIGTSIDILDSESFIESLLRNSYEGSILKIGPFGLEGYHEFPLWNIASAIKQARIRCNILPINRSLQTLQQ